MSDYRLDLIIDEEHLRLLKSANQNVTLAKPVGGGSPNVAWLVFDPFEANTIEWSEEFGLYASPNKVIESGAVISRVSDKFPVCDAAYYTLQSDATFHGPYTDSHAPLTGQYKVINNMPYSSYTALTFGLEQEAVINGKTIKSTPINAAIVPAEQSAKFEPITTVFVWLQNSYTSGTVITDILSKSTRVTFGGDITQETLKYDPNTGSFRPLSSSIPPHIKLLKKSGIY